MLSFQSRNELALIIHDMKNDSLKVGGKVVTLHGIASGTEQIINNQASLLAAARNYGLSVFFTGHFLREDYMDAAYRSPIAKYGANRDGTLGADIIDELKPLNGEIIIRKGGGYSSFTGTPLENGFVVLESK